MKRNESFLVYGVTGLLLVILFVAVVFGRENAPITPQDSTAATHRAAELDELMHLNPALALDPGKAASDATASPNQAGEAPPVVEAQAPAPSPAEAAASTLAAAYGLSTRHGNYREVEVRSGDTVSQLVERWCGGLHALPVVEALNEDLDKKRLKPGRKLILPWVDDEVLVAKRAETVSAPAPAPEVVAKPAASVEQPSVESVASVKTIPGKAYRLKVGDTLWGLAAGATQTRGEAAGYVARIMKLNPGLVPERLRPGHEIKLPSD